MNQKKQLVLKVDGQKIVVPEEERQRCEVWTRVMGYLRPVENWNYGKKSEFKERKFFVEPKELK